MAVYIIGSIPPDPGVGLEDGATIAFASTAPIGTHSLNITTFGLGDGLLEAGTLGQDIGTFNHPVSGMLIQQENPASQEVIYNDDLGFRHLRSRGNAPIGSSRTGSWQFDLGQWYLNTDLLVSRWTYPTLTGVTAGLNERQWKNLRFHPYPFLNYDDPPGNENTGGNAFYQASAGLNFTGRIIHIGPTGVAQSLDGYVPPANQARWHRLDTLFNPGSVDTANGYVYSRQVIPTTGVYYPWDYYGPASNGAVSFNRVFTSSAYNWPKGIRYIHVEDYREQALEGSCIYHTDYYVQIGSKKLIEIGNAPEYTDCSHTEIQYPLSWANLSGSFRLHRGRLASFEDLTVFVTEVVNGSVVVLAKGPLTGTSIMLN